MPVSSIVSLSLSHYRSWRSRCSFIRSAGEFRQIAPTSFKSFNLILLQACPDRVWWNVRKFRTCAGGDDIFPTPPYSASNKRAVSYWVRWATLAKPRILYIYNYNYQSLNVIGRAYHIPWNAGSFELLQCDSDKVFFQLPLICNQFTMLVFKKFKIGYGKDVWFQSPHQPNFPACTSWWRHSSLLRHSCSVPQGTTCLCHCLPH